MNDEPMDQPLSDAELIDLETAPTDADSPDSAPTEPSGRARLTLKRGGELTDQVFPFMCPAMIGRFDPSVGPIDVDLGSIPEGSYVSRKHAKIVFADGVFSILDLGSSNGTYVLRDDYEKVDEASLNDGDTVGFGNAIFVFNIEA